MAACTMTDQPDSLEDWIAIKSHPFAMEEKRSKLVFHVAWNDVESRVAVTCRRCADNAAWTAALTFRSQCDVN